MLASDAWAASSAPIIGGLLIGAGLSNNATFDLYSFIALTGALVTLVVRDVRDVRDNEPTAESVVAAQTRRERLRRPHDA